MFSTVTSAFFSMERTISRPRGDLRFNVSDFLLALNWWKYQGSLSGWPGRRRRPGSPVVGFSILTTSAPSQARDSVQDGPASNWVKSTTLIPSRQSSSTPISAIARSSWAAMLEYLLAARNPLTRGGRFRAKRIRLGFIGANIRATWAAQSHFPALLASPEVELTAVCTTRRETAEAAREAFGAKLAFSDFREMVVSKEIDAVAVADACCD